MKRGVDKRQKKQPRNVFFLFQIKFCFPAGTKRGNKQSRQQKSRTCKHTYAHKAYHSIENKYLTFPPSDDKIK